MTIARIFLFLSIVNFALAAPIVVRAVQEVRVNVADVAEDGTATSQKPWEPLNDWMTIPAPQQLQDLQNLDHFPRSLTGSRPRSADDSPPPSSWSPEYSPIPWVLDQSSTSSPDYSQPSQLSTDYSPPGSTDNSYPSTDYSPPSSTDNSRQASSDHYLPSSADNPRPSSSDDYHSSSPDYSGSLPGFTNADPHPSGPGYFLSSPSGSTDYSPPSSSQTGPLQWQSTEGGPLSSSEPPRPTEPQTKEFINQLGATGGPPSPAEPETKNFISQLGPEPSHSEPEAKDFLSYLLAGKIKRRISGSSAMNSVQES